MKKKREFKKRYNRDRREALVDKTPPGTPYEGNLQYGRLFGTKEPRSHFNDYSAERSNGVSTNKARVSLPFSFKRDSRYWSSKVKPAVKNITNGNDYRNLVLKELMKSYNRGGLGQSVSTLKLGKEVLKVKQ